MNPSAPQPTSTPAQPEILHLAAPHAFVVFICSYLFIDYHSYSQNRPIHLSLSSQEPITKFLNLNFLLLRSPRTPLAPLPPKNGYMNPAGQTDSRKKKGVSLTDLLRPHFFLHHNYFRYITRRQLSLIKLATSRANKNNFNREKWFQCPC